MVPVKIIALKAPVRQARAVVVVAAVLVAHQVRTTMIAPAQAVGAVTEVAAVAVVAAALLAQLVEMAAALSAAPPVTVQAVVVVVAIMRSVTRPVEMVVGPIPEVVRVAASAVQPGPVPQLVRVAAEVHKLPRKRKFGVRSAEFEE